MARNTKNQKIPYKFRAIPSHDDAPELVKVLNLSGPKATAAAYVVNTYRMPMPSVASSTARCTVRFGWRLSSASGAAPSNPPNASTVYTDPAITPVSPLYPLGVWLVVKTLNVLWLPAGTTKNTASTRNTAISVVPRIVPSLADASRARAARWTRRTAGRRSARTRRRAAATRQRTRPRHG